MSIAIFGICLKIDSAMLQALKYCHLTPLCFSGSSNEKKNREVRHLLQTTTSPSFLEVRHTVARLYYPLLWQGRNSATLNHHTPQDGRGGLRGRFKRFSEALSSFPGSPGNKNRFFQSHSTPCGKPQTKIQTPPPLSSSLLLLLFLAVPTVQFR